MLSKKQEKELRKFLPEIKQIHSDLNIVKHSGQMPKGGEWRYSRYRTKGLIKLGHRTTPTGAKVINRVLLTKKGKELLESFRL